MTEPLDLDAIRQEWINHSAEHEQDLLLAISDACCTGCDVARFVPRLLAEVERLRAELDRVDRVRELHPARQVPTAPVGYLVCGYCDQGPPPARHVPWPCPTIRAIDGEVPDAPS